MDGASWNWFSAGTSYHFPSILYHYILPGPLSPNSIQNLRAAAWRHWRRLAYQHVGRPLHDSMKQSLFSCVAAKENGSKNIIMQNGEDTTGATWLQFLQESKKKRREICPFQLLYVSVIWRYTQLHANRNNRGILISISLGKRLYPSFLFLGLGQKQEY